MYNPTGRNPIKSILQCLLLTLFAVVSPISLYGQQTGDIAFVGLNTNSGGGFAVVALSDLPPDLDLYIASGKWNGSSFDAGDEKIKWNTGASSIGAGSVIVFENISDSRTVSVNKGSISSGRISFSGSGNGLFAYTENKTGPNPYTFLSAVSTSGYDGANNTLEGTGLLQGTTAVVLPEGTVMAEYTGSRSGKNPEGYLADLSDTGRNWNLISNENKARANITFDTSEFSFVELPAVAFVKPSNRLVEDEGVATIAVELVEANGVAVDVRVVFVEGSSTAGLADIAEYETTTVHFPSDAKSGASKTVKVNLTDDSDYEGREHAFFELRQNSAGTVVNPNKTSLIIDDDDAPNIVINEILYNPLGDANGDGTISRSGDQFIELVNRGTTDLDIGNWVLSGEDNIRYTFPIETVIPPGRSVVVFADTAEGYHFGGALLHAAGSLDLNDESDIVILKDAEENIISSVTYSDENAKGSLTRNDGNAGNFEPHPVVGDEGYFAFSPGKRVDGTAFGSDFGMGIRGGEGWRLVASPVSNTTFDEFFNPLWIQGIAGSDQPSGNSNIYTWSEEEGGAFESPSDMTAELDPGRGYLVYIYEDDQLNRAGVQGGFPKIISINGSENSSPVSVAVSANDSNESLNIDDEEGWNLLGNPYGIPLSVSALLDALEAVDPSINSHIYVWDPTAGGGQGSYVTISDGDQLGPFEAFWVRYTDVGVSGNVSLDRSVLAAKSTAGELFEEVENSHLKIKLNLSDGTFFDTYLVEFNDEAVLGLDPYDAYKLLSPNSASVNFFSTISGNKIQKNALPIEMDQSVEIPLAFAASGREALEFTWQGVDNLPAGWEVRLIDAELNREIDLSSVENYSFAIPEDRREPTLSTSPAELQFGKSNDSNETARFLLSITPPGVATGSNNNLPEEIKLNPNYPNPFNPTTTIAYEIKEETRVKLSVWNIVGQKVATLVDEMQEAGEHKAVWNATEMPSGLYIAQLEVNGRVFIRKMTLIK